MAPSLRLGRIFGIEIGANWSLIFVFGLIAWTLASTVLPQDVKGQSTLAYWATGVIGAIAFYVGLLAHELAHALTARRSGVKVSGITLWLFGGVSRLDGEPPNARSEALITAVGPLTSLAVALLMLLLALGLSAAGAPALASDLLLWLGWINLTLAVFNLIPAFPLDGGRLLAALMWGRQGSRAAGVHSAVRVGRVIAYGMIAFGLLEVFLGSVLNGVWIAFLGWFLLSAASAEEAGIVTLALLRSVPVSAAMSSPVIVVPNWLTAESFLSGVAPQHHFTTYPVHAPSGDLTGVVRLRQVLGVPPGQRHERHLSEVAIPIADIPTATPQEDLDVVLRRAGESINKRLLVFDGGQLVGIVSPADVSRLLARRQAVGAARPS
jgi:Zn-dependent protease/CBS domain-containing protein